MLNTYSISYCSYINLLFFVITSTFKVIFFAFRFLWHIDINHLYLLSFCLLFILFFLHIDTCLTNIIFGNVFLFNFYTDNMNQILTFWAFYHLALLSWSFADSTFIAFIWFFIFAFNFFCFINVDFVLIFSLFLHNPRFSLLNNDLFYLFDFWGCLTFRTISSVIDWNWRFICHFRRLL